jgi:maleylpyruvate isomerase
VTATSPPAVTDSLAWAADGAAHLRGLMSRLGDDAFRAPSLLPGWSRAHVLTHLARNADGMVNLLTWARTGVPTPAYASREQRDADIEAGARRTAPDIRDDVVETSDRLAQEVRAMPEEAWSARVRNVQGREIPATDIPWIRARELWVHAVDLNVGAAFTDLPGPMVRELLEDVMPTLAAADGCPPLRLVARDQDATWTLGDGADPTQVSGTAPALVAWLLGRSRGRDLQTADDRPLPPLPPWL